MGLDRGAGAAAEDLSDPRHRKKNIYIYSYMMGYVENVVYRQVKMTFVIEAT